MTVLEYAQKLTNNRIIISADDGGNVYLDLSNISIWHDVDFMYTFATHKYKDNIFISKEDMDKLNEYSIIVEDNCIHTASLTRRPYYRMRGKPVTRQQAFDIIRRTDNFFVCNSVDISRCPDFIHAINFYNWLINRNHYPMGYGWIHTDGTVGINSITQKYPDNASYIAEWLEKLVAFPYLDLIIAVTCWNEMPTKAWDRLGQEDEKDYEFADDEFFEAVDVGIYVHHKTVEILSPQQTVKKYKEYATLYEDKNKEKYIPDYYQKNNIEQIDEEYLKRCIESYGFDASQLLRQIPQHQWKKKK